MRASPHIHAIKTNAVINGTSALTYYIYHNELSGIPAGKKVSVSFILEDDTRDILLDGHSVDLEIGE